MHTDQQYTIMVLNDGETYSDISGCAILIINEDAHIQLGEGRPLDDIDPEDIIGEIYLR